jgi:hypothetical protein
MNRSNCPHPSIEATEDTGEQTLYMSSSRVDPELFRTCRVHKEVREGGMEDPDGIQFSVDDGAQIPKVQLGISILQG